MGRYQPNPRYRKIDKSHKHRFKTLFEQEQRIDEEIDLWAKENGWADGKSYILAQKKNIVDYINGKKPKFSGV